MSTKRQKQLAELNAVLEKLVETQARLIEGQQNEIQSLEGIIQVLTENEEYEEVTLH